MLMDTGGNAGSQSATLIIRGLALGEIEPKDTLRVLSEGAKGKSFLVGLVLSIIDLVRILVFDKVEFTIGISGSIYLNVYYSDYCKAWRCNAPYRSKKAKARPCYYG